MEVGGPASFCPGASAVGQVFPFGQGFVFVGVEMSWAESVPAAPNATTVARIRIFIRFQIRRHFSCICFVVKTLYSPETLMTDLIIRSSAIHAAGCYTVSPIRKGGIVVEYDGPRIAKEVADERYAERDVTYLFGLSGTDTVIDGFSAAMFINHCCEPNCESEEEDGRIFIRALRPIRAGEELTYMYNLYDSDDDDTQDCYCGSAKCRRTMFSDAEVRRRKKLAKAKQA